VHQAYVAGVEEFNITIIHSFVSTGFGISKSVRNMGGKLINQTGDTILRFSAAGGGDDISLANILKAAGRQIDEKADSTSRPDTYRREGMALVFLVDYHNYVNWGDPTIQYTYRVFFTEQTSWNYNDVDYTSNHTRIWRRRSGVQLIFVQSGAIKKFDFATCLVQLSSSMSLIAIATIIVEVLMLHIMPLRERYKKAKFDVTEDFTALHKDINFMGQIKEKLHIGDKHGERGHGHDEAQEHAPTQGEGLRTSLLSQRV